MPKEKWVMPKWMEKYRDKFLNTGGNSVEDLINMTGDDTAGNIILGALCISVADQMNLLTKLHNEGALK